MTFREFRLGAASPFLRTLGLDLNGVTTWDGYMEHVLQQPRDALAATAREIAAKSSSGQRTLLAALMAAATLRSLAEELQPEPWVGFDNLDRETRIAVAATIARQDA